MIVQFPRIFRFSAIPPRTPSRPQGQGEVLRSGVRDDSTGEFEKFFWRYESTLGRYLWQMTHDEQAAYDLSQETFIRAWHHFAAIKDHPQVKAWLFRVAFHLAFRFLRQRSHHPEVALGALHPGQSDPGRHVAEHDLITQTLQSLTEKQRSALLLHEVQGFSCVEIGQLLSMSPDAVKMALFRAREQFRRTYQHAEEM